MDTLPPADPRLALAALWMRIERERGRLGGSEALPATEIVGGWARLGGFLDHLFRAVLVQVCRLQGRDPELAFREYAAPGWTIDRASAGQLLHAVLSATRARPASDPWLAALVRALEHNILRQVLELRNILVHSRRDPTREELRVALEGLRRWMLDGGYAPGP